MGRRRLHGEDTRNALLIAAEQLVAEHGIDALSVREVATRAGTTTRAVYVLFGSKDSLLEALARHSFELLMAAMDAVPPRSDPGEDLVTRSVQGFRAFALEHPDLFRLFFATRTPRAIWSAEATATRSAAYAQLSALVGRAQQAGLLGVHDIEEATLLWDALCIGLALREICGPIPQTEGERLWSEALQAFLRGMGPEARTAINLAARSR
jgi:AcrR family transcriptional regulator